MMKAAHYYRQMLALLTARIKQGERDIERLTEQGRQQLTATGDLSAREINEITRAVHRDLAEFARSYAENDTSSGSGVFMRIIEQSIWKELADVTDKSQLEWQEIFQDLSHHGVYESSEVVGLGNLVCEQCQYSHAVYMPETLTDCPQCGGSRFRRQPFEP